MQQVAKPYVKQYNEAGELVNPITKGNPYFSIGKSRGERRGRLRQTFDSIRGMFVMQRKTATGGWCNA